MVRMRAAENRRWILRPTNNGITVTIDPAGRIIDRLAPDRQAVLRTHYSYIREQTPYTRYGDWFVLACAVVAMVGCILPR